MVLHGVSYAVLKVRLASIGTHQNEANLRNKISKGIMGAQLFLQILTVLGCEKLDMSDVGKILAEIESNQGQT